MSSEQPGTDDELSEPAGEELPPPPPEPEVEIEPPEEVEALSEEPVEEEYEEIEPERERPRPKKKNRHLGSIIVLIVIVVALVLWTLLSPNVMREVGDTYVRGSSPAQNLANYTGTRDIWSGRTDWGISVSGENRTTVGTEIAIHVLVTKVYEKPGNFFFRGTAITLRNVSIFDRDGTFLASMSSKADVGYGIEATVKLAFDTSGTQEIVVYVKFVVYECMRIGFIPLEGVQTPTTYDHGITAVIEVT